MLPAPYWGSPVHWASVVQAPQVSGVAMPQSWPVGQSDEGPWQSPEMQPPDTQTVVTPYDGSAWQEASLPHAWQVCVGRSQIWRPVQSVELWQLPATQTFPMHRCCGPYAATHDVSVVHAPQVCVAAYGPQHLCIGNVCVAGN